MRRLTENNSLIPAVLAALAHLPEVFCFPVRLGVRGKLRVRVVPKGTPDILGVVAHYRTLPAPAVDFGKLAPDFHGAVARMVMDRPVVVLGRALAVETKGTHSDRCKCGSCAAQAAFRIEWESRGGLYIKARDVVTVLDAIRGRRAA